LPLLKFRIDANPADILTFEVKKIINAGYTGRNQAEVQKHIDELKEKGIPGPDEIPTYFPKYKERITQEEDIEALDTAGHTGEAEYVLLCTDQEIYVTVGSDHTDRLLEQASIPKAKQHYPNFISRDVWKLSQIRAHFDQIILRSRIEHEGKKIIFQEAPLSAMLSPDDLLERVKKIVIDTDGLVIYSGTIAAKADLDCTPVFETELEDPVRNLKLSCSYRLRPVTTWFKGKF
jgi:hypothetical protein